MCAPEICARVSKVLRARSASGAELVQAWVTEDEALITFKLT